LFPKRDSRESGRPPRFVGSGGQSGGIEAACVGATEEERRAAAPCQLVDQGIAKDRGDRHSSPAWKSIPSWYLLGTEDKAIPPATQRFMAERATATIEELPASHASMVSQPDVATELIVTAANATAGATA
jgi:pimeloyl-ACP methyl ester carboxylesterase